MAWWRRTGGYGTWVTAAQLSQLPGVGLGRIHGRPATVHAEGCPSATDRAHPLSTMQALDALARPGD
ncbi:DUF6233 domain-containing protein [Streptomyces sp. NPDC048357]|uniref:DUF6233 domain-containing protein n=1 Tax=Streptomyces sp. NPDC048357 TaxID=3154719 RepID=UPI0034414046